MGDTGSLLIGLGIYSMAVNLLRQIKRATSKGCRNLFGTGINFAILNRAHI
jgi:RNase P subunit RPR2